MSGLPDGGLRPAIIARQGDALAAQQVSAVIGGPQGVVLVEPFRFARNISTSPTATAAGMFDFGGTGETDAEGNPVGLGLAALVVLAAVFGVVIRLVK